MKNFERIINDGREGEDVADAGRGCESLEWNEWIDAGSIGQAAELRDKLQFQSFTREP